MEKIINHKATKGPTKRVPSLASALRPKIGSKPINVFPLSCSTNRVRTITRETRPPTYPNPKPLPEIAPVSDLFPNEGSCALLKM